MRLSETTLSLWTDSWDREANKAIIREVTHRTLGAVTEFVADYVGGKVVEKIKKPASKLTAKFSKRLAKEIVESGSPKIIYEVGEKIYRETKEGILRELMETAYPTVLANSHDDILRKMVEETGKSADEVTIEAFLLAEKTASKYLEESADVYARQMADAFIEETVQEVVTETGVEVAETVGGVTISKQAEELIGFIMNEEGAHSGSVGDFIGDVTGDFIGETAGDVLGFAADIGIAMAGPQWTILGNSLTFFGQSLSGALAEEFDFGTESLTDCAITVKDKDPSSIRILPGSIEIGKLSAGATLTVSKRKSDWFRIESTTLPGIPAWISIDDVTTSGDDCGTG